MASLREIGQGLADVAREVGDALRNAGNRVLDADLAPAAEALGMLLLVSMVALVFLGFLWAVKRIVEELGFGPQLNRGAAFLGKATGIVFFTALLVLIVASWASVATTPGRVFGLIAFIAVMAGLWWLARQGRAARDAESNASGQQQQP